MTTKYTINQINYLLSKSLKSLAEVKHAYRERAYLALKHKYKLDKTLIKNELKSITLLKKEVQAVERISRRYSQNNDKLLKDLQKEINDRCDEIDILLESLSPLII